MSRNIVVGTLAVIVIGLSIVAGVLINTNSDLEERNTQLQKEVATLTVGINNIQWFEARIPEDEALRALYASGLERITIDGVIFTRYSNEYGSGIQISYSSEYLSYGRYPQGTGVPKFELGEWVEVGEQAPVVSYIINPSENSPVSIELKFQAQ